MTMAFKSFRLGVILVSLCAAVTQPAGRAQSQASEPAPFSVALSAVSNSIQAGSPLMVKIVTTNTSDHTLTFWQEKAEDQAGWSYGAVVLDENGQTPPDTVLRRLIKYSASPNQGIATWLMPSGVFRELKPGESFTTVSDLGRLYDFSRPGRYEIYVRESTELDATLVRSNSIFVTVSPALSIPQTAAASSAAGSPGFTLTVNPSSVTIDRKTVSAGLAGISLQVVTKNISDHNIVLWVEKWNQEQVGAAYQVEARVRSGACITTGLESTVQADCGKPLSDTEFGKQARSRTDVPSETNPDVFEGPGGERMVLKPGESWTDKIYLGKLYQEPAPGEYSFLIKRFDPATKTMVKANEVTVTVTP